MVALAIDEGRLVKLANATHIETFAYYLVYPEASHGQSKITAFRDWILGIASSSDQRPAN